MTLDEFLKQQRRELRQFEAWARDREGFEDLSVNAWGDALFTMTQAPPETDPEEEPEDPCRHP